jgi:hypothetical protein
VFETPERVRRRRIDQQHFHDVFLESVDSSRELIGTRRLSRNSIGRHVSKQAKFLGSVSIYARR